MSASGDSVIYAGQRHLDDRASATDDDRTSATLDGRASVSVDDRAPATGSIIYAGQRLVNDPASTTGSVVYAGQRPLNDRSSTPGSVLIDADRSDSGCWPAGRSLPARLRDIDQPTPPNPRDDDLRGYIAYFSVRELARPAVRQPQKVVSLSAGEKKAMMTRMCLPPWLSLGLSRDPNYQLRLMLPGFVPPQWPGLDSVSFRELFGMSMDDYQIGLYNLDGHLIERSELSTTAMRSALLLGIGDLAVPGGGIWISPETIQADGRNPTKVQVQAEHYSRARFSVFLVHWEQPRHWAGVVVDNNPEARRAFYYDPHEMGRDDRSRRFWGGQFRAYISQLGWTPGVLRESTWVTVPVPGQVGVWECGLTVVECVRTAFRQYDARPDRFAQTWKYSKLIPLGTLDDANWKAKGLNHVISRWCRAVRSMFGTRRPLRPGRLRAPARDNARYKRYEAQFEAMGMTPTDGIPAVPFTTELRPPERALNWNYSCMELTEEELSVCDPSTPAGRLQMARAMASVYPRLAQR